METVGIRGDDMGQALQKVYFDNYSPVGDIIVMAICMVIVILVATSYVEKTRNFNLFLNILVYIVIAAVANVGYHEWSVYITNGNYFWVYVIRIIYHIAIFSILLTYIAYILELMHIELYRKGPIMIVALVFYVIVVLWDILSSISKKGFKINPDGTYNSSIYVFWIGYVGFVTMGIILMIVFRDKLYRQILRGFYGTIIIAFFILYLQGKHDQNSYTLVTFLFPVIGMLYLIHSNPYDMELGAISSRALEDMILYNFDKGIDMFMISLYLPDFDYDSAVLPESVQKGIRSTSGNYFNSAILFQISKGHVVLVAKRSTNKDIESRINNMLEAFDAEYEKLRLDYKIVICESLIDLKIKNDCAALINSVHRHMDINSVHRIIQTDVDRFMRYEYILSELTDIVRGGNLRDPRVLAYCQPVYNISTGKYDTAEALMRLKLSEIGMVFPDQFIPLAEENGYIHSLTKIILQRTCDEIRYLVKENYDVKRISVNVSVLEMRDESFITDIEKIIEESEIPKDKIAIEITESQNDDDFMIMKDKVDRLKDMGIKIYLDDFGTGYSNMERIMELPFDIIKFDRSLVLASSTDNRSEKMVGSLAEMFSDLNYSVLYEGVETEDDEKRCTELSASYLQGYKYSKPVPIMDLKNFFSKLEQEENHA